MKARLRRPFGAPPGSVEGRGRAHQSDASKEALTVGVTF